MLGLCQETSFQPRTFVILGFYVIQIVFFLPKSSATIKRTFGGLAGCVKETSPSIMMITW